MELSLLQTKQVIAAVEDDVDYFDDLIQNIVKEQMQDLDDIMTSINENIIRCEYPTIDVLEKHFLELSNCLYFMQCKAEKFGIYDTVSKLNYKEVYNDAYLNATEKTPDRKNKLTVAELTAIAESTAKYEAVVNDVYNRAYKIIKNKLSAAETMISSLSKIISKRMTEMQLDNVLVNVKQSRLLVESEGNTLNG